MFLIHSGYRLKVFACFQRLLMAVGMVRRVIMLRDSFVAVLDFGV